MSYIFVGGAQRSGTSLLASSLCAGEESNPYLGESSSLRRLLDAQSHMVQRFDDETKFHFGTRPVMQEFMSTTLRSFLGLTLASSAPATSLVLKEPHMTTHFPLIHQLLPEAKFVISIRDPRDTISSMMTVGKKLKEGGSSHLFATDNVKKMAELVGSFYRPTLLASQKMPMFASAVKWVKYEQLVSEPEKTMDELRKFTGLKLEQYDVNDPRKRTHPDKTKSREKSQTAKPWQSELMGQKSVSTKSVGSFEDKLSKKQIATIEQTLPGLIKRFGYKTVSN